MKDGGKINPNFKIQILQNNPKIPNPKSQRAGNDITGGLLVDFVFNMVLQPTKTRRFNSMLPHFDNQVNKI